MCAENVQECEHLPRNRPGGDKCRVSFELKGCSDPSSSTSFLNLSAREGGYKCPEPTEAPAVTPEIPSTPGAKPERLRLDELNEENYEAFTNLLLEGCEVKSPASQKVRFGCVVTSIDDNEKQNVKLKPHESDELQKKALASPSSTTARKSVEPRDFDDLLIAPSKGQSDEQSGDPEVGSRCSASSPGESVQSDDKEDSRDSVSLEERTAPTEQQASDPPRDVRLSAGSEEATFPNPDPTAANSSPKPVSLGTFESDCSDDSSLEDELPRGRQARRKLKKYRKHTRRDQTPVSPKN